MTFMYWIDLGVDYRAIEVLLVSREVINTKSKDLGVYTQDDETEGLWGPDEHSIYIVESPVHNTLEFILLHELTHAFDDLCDMHETDENKVDCKAALLGAFLRENTELIDKIRRKELNKTDYV